MTRYRGFKTFPNVYCGTDKFDIKINFTVLYPDETHTGKPLSHVSSFRLNLYHLNIK